MSERSLIYLEDDEALAAVTCRGLQRAGFTVKHVADLAAFQAALHAQLYDCALLDLKIERDHSLVLLPRIKKQIAGAIVILTGYGTIKTAVQAMQLGACDFLTKPCAMHDIVKALMKPRVATTPEPALLTSQPIADKKDMVGEKRDSKGLFSDRNIVSDRDIVRDKDITRPSLKSQEREAIQQALDDNNGNISAAARQLKMHRRTLQRKLQKKHLDTLSKS